MEPIKLAADLKAFGDRSIPGNEEVWIELIRPQLPAAPLEAGFLAEALAPLTLHGRTAVLGFLSRLGRREVAGHAAALLAEAAEGSDRLELGRVLAECGDPRGLAAVEELYRYSLDHLHDDPSAVPLEWITEDVLKQLGTDAALALRRRLIGLENERRARKN